MQADTQGTRTSNLASFMITPINRVQKLLRGALTSRTDPPLYIVTEHEIIHESLVCELHYSISQIAVSFEPQVRRVLLTDDLIIWERLGQNCIDNSLRRVVSNCSCDYGVHMQEGTFFAKFTNQLPVICRPL